MLPCPVVKLRILRIVNPAHSTRNSSVLSLIHLRIFAGRIKCNLAKCRHKDFYDCSASTVSEKHLSLFLRNFKDNTKRRPEGMATGMFVNCGKFGKPSKYQTKHWKFYFGNANRWKGKENIHASDLKNILSNNILMCAKKETVVVNHQSP